MTDFSKYDISRKYDLAQKINNNKFWNNDDGYEIPYNQRSYVWEGDNIIRYMNDINDYVQQKITFITLGTYYFLKETKDVTTSKITIWDGQQRIITSYILLASIYKIAQNMQSEIEQKIKKYEKKDDTSKNKKMLKKINEQYDKCGIIIGKVKNYMFKKDYKLTQSEKEDLKKNIYTPKIYTIYPNDNEILKKICNLDIESLNMCYDKKEDMYICKNCKKEYKTECHIKKHLYRCDGNMFDELHDILKDYKNDKKIEEHHMIKAQYEMIKFLNENIGNDIDELNKFLIVFEEYIPHEEYICKEIDCATMIFDLLNNRGINLKQSDIIRNSLIRLLPESKRAEYFLKFEKIIESSKKLEHRIKSEEIYFKILCIMTNKKIKNIDSIAEEYKLLLGDDIEKNFKKIEKNIKMLEDIDVLIQNNKWNVIYELDHILEIYQCILIPFCQMCKDDKNFKKIFDKIMEIIVCYQLKSCFKMRNYSSIKNELCVFGNNIYNEQYDIDDIHVKLIDFVNNVMLKKIGSNIFDMLKNSSVTQNNAKKILLYYELKNRTEAIKLDVSMIDIEHIMPKSSGNDIVGRIGNLTLLEKINSENGHKGNRSLQDKPIKAKMKEYKGSSYWITNNITCIKENKWTHEDINKRTQIIINSMNKYCEKILGNTVKSYDSDIDSETENNSSDDSESDSESSSESSVDKKKNKPEKIKKNK